VVIANTVKSRGLSFAEDRADYHYWKASQEQIEQAERDLSALEKEAAQ
jgi:hypothetical protein